MDRKRLELLDAEATWSTATPATNYGLPIHSDCGGLRPHDPLIKSEVLLTN